jgi:hypothetical protein
MRGFYFFTLLPLTYINIFGSILSMSAELAIIVPLKTAAGGFEQGNRQQATGNYTHL